LSLLSYSCIEIGLTLNDCVHILAELLMFWTFPHFSTKAGDNFVDSNRLDRVFPPLFKASI